MNQISKDIKISSAYIMTSVYLTGYFLATEKIAQIFLFILGLIHILVACHLMKK